MRTGWAQYDPHAVPSLPEGRMRIAQRELDGIVECGHRIYWSAERSSAVHAAAVDALLNGARIAEEVTIPGDRLADMCELLVFLLAKGTVWSTKPGTEEP